MRRDEDVDGFVDRSELLDLSAAPVWDDRLQYLQLPMGEEAPL